MKIPKLSALNLAPLRQGQTPKEALEAMFRLAQKVENLDYERFWIAEHHNMKHLLSSATQVLVGQTLAQTQKIRVGSGGVMLPNHSPLMVAEQYGTLETLYPNRVDLGLGRAPGTDGKTAMALRRHLNDLSQQFPKDIADLQRYFADELEQEQVKAYPALGLNVPLYILGSSTESAFLAGHLGLPYAFAAHFAPQMLGAAVEIYRQEFKPSASLDKPYMIICTNVTVGDDDAHAEFLMSTIYQMFWDMVRAAPPRGMCPPVENMNQLWQPHERAAAMQMLNASIFGSAESVKSQIIDFQQKYNADELMITNYIFDEQEQHRTYERIKQIIDNL